MLETLLNNPKRLFVIVAMLLAYGLYSAMQLPVSMYPASSKPEISVWIQYGTLSRDEFQREYGGQIEGKILKISDSGYKVSELKANYEATGAYYEVYFDWDVPYGKALGEVESVVSASSSFLPRDIAESIGVWQRNKNSGFFAASVYSSEVGLRELYKKIEPVLKPSLDKISDADFAVLWNPEQYSITISLIPEKLAVYGLFPRDVRGQVESALSSYAGSDVEFGKKTEQFQIKAFVESVEDLENFEIHFNNSRIKLADIAKVEFGKDRNRQRLFKTNGKKSLILFARPKSGGNVKRMSDDIMNILAEKKDALPKGTQFKNLVDPSQTISNSVRSLTKDVFVASLMAVLVLFLFIGNIKNIATAAIEIPSSMILSLILMKIAGMNINLISLGGLALAAGMNVDASIVIMENIFKHRETWATLGRSLDTFKSRVTLVAGAVKEVAFPVILSIATTLIVFIPMVFTSNLTNAILGDLARAVTFSHAISGLVALIVVPTVRVLLMDPKVQVKKAPLEDALIGFQELYIRLLKKVLGVKHIEKLAVGSVFSILALLLIFVLPDLPKKIVGKPKSDWIIMGINSSSASSVQQMDGLIQMAENEALKLIGEKVDYTWMERNNKNYGQLMFRLFDRNDMESVQKTLDDHFVNTPKVSYWVNDWNPAELPLPREWHLKLSVQGGEDFDRFKSAERIKYFLKDLGDYQRIKVDPSSSGDSQFTFTPFAFQWNNLNANERSLTPSDIADISFLSSKSANIGSLAFMGRSTEVQLKLSDKRFTDPELLKSYPIKVKDKIVPLKALGEFKSVLNPSQVLVEDGTEKINIYGKVRDEDKDRWESIQAASEEKLQTALTSLLTSKDVTVTFHHPQAELKEALDQLMTSLALSLGLVFFILWMQFQSVKQVLTIMMTIPLGVCGVILSLKIFGSYLSLNSALGIILLSGITVNNSILLVDVRNKFKEKGLSGIDIIIETCKSRLRPILITSLTTVLGMFPVALGLGDGGEILQPLGIAVTSGLFVATGLTIFVVPVLMYQDRPISTKLNLSKLLDRSHRQIAKGTSQVEVGH